MEEKENDAHNATVEELCKSFNTSIEAGLTDKQVAEALEEHDDDDRYHRHHHYRNHHIPGWHKVRELANRVHR